MASLMKLDGENYSNTITEMLNDSRAGVVTTVRNLIMKMSLPDYDKVREIFVTTEYKHTKLKCLDILFSASNGRALFICLRQFRMMTSK